MNPKNILLIAVVAIAAVIAAKRIPKLKDLL